MHSVLERKRNSKTVKIMPEPETKSASIPPTWDLTQLFASEKALIQEIKIVEEKVKQFVRLKEIKKEDWTSEFLGEVALEYNQIFSTFGNIRTYLSMVSDLDTTNSGIQSFSKKYNSQLNELNNQLSFFRRTFRDIDQTVIDRSLTGHELSLFLKYRKQDTPHILSEEQEKEISRNFVSTAGEWRSMTNAILTNITITLEDEKGKTTHIPFRESGNFRASTVPKVRETVFDLQIKKYEEYHTVLESFFQKIVKNRNHEIVNLRSYPTSISSNNFYEELDDSWVRELNQEMLKNKEVVHEEVLFFKNLFNLGDSIAHVNGRPKELSKVELNSDECITLVKDSFEKFCPEWRDIVQNLIEQKRVDLNYSPFKKMMGTCYNIVNQESFLTVNGSNWSILSHELGHAIHNHYKKDRFTLVNLSSVSIAELASQFAENLTQKLYLERYRPNDSEKALSSAYRLRSNQQTILFDFLMTEFEIKAHEMIINGDPIEKVNQEYLQTIKNVYGNYFDYPEELKYDYLFMQDAYQRPFVKFTYGLGLIATKLLYENYLEEPAATVQDYNKMLSFGGTKKTLEHFEAIGLPTEPKELAQRIKNSFRQELNELKKLDWSFLKE